MIKIVRRAAGLMLLIVLLFSITACGRTVSDSMCGSTGEQAMNGQTTLIAEPEDSPAAVKPQESIGDSGLSQYEIGDIILSDGSIVKREELVSVDSSNMPMAVIAGHREGGTAFGIGVHRSDMPLQWASDDSTGYVTGFGEIACTRESEIVFSGDNDGSDNWDVICALDSEDTIDAETKYPAFYFVGTYAENHDLSGDYASGWYMPGIAELCDIYQNCESVNDSLRHIYELDDQAAMNGLGTNWYWSSSQAGCQDDYAWFVHYFNGYAGECPKNFTNVHALAVHEVMSREK